MAYSANTACYIVMSFKLEEVPQEDKIIFGDLGLMRGMSINKDRVILHGTMESAAFKYTPNRWNTICIFWKNYGDYKGFYLSNGERKEFTTRMVSTKQPTEKILLGRKYIGSIAAFEGYIFEDQEYPSELIMDVIDAQEEIVGL